MQKCLKVRSAREVSNQITEAQTLIQKIKQDYHTAAVIASSAAYTIEKMSGEINVLSEKLEQLTAIRQGGTLKVLSFAGKEQQS